MRMKKWLTLSLAAVLLIGTTVTAGAAELDYAWYAAQNPDVVAELGDSPEALQAHYEMFGRKEGRAANSRDVEAQLRKLFKAEEYASLYPDVKAFYGDDAEALFRHYIGYGLLEARRPSEKVPQTVAVTLKAAVEKAMADAGIAAAPGSVQLVEIITDTIPADEGGQAVQQALAQAAPEVEKAVEEAVKETTDPKPVPSNGGGSSSSNSGGGGSSDVTPEVNYPTIKVYKEVTYSGGITALGTAASVTMTGGKGTAAEPYTADVTDIVKVPAESDTYWYAVALPCETESHYWLKLTDWTDVTDNVTNIGGVEAGHMTYAIGDDGSGGLTDICMSTATTKDALSADENAVYYRLNVSFKAAEEEEPEPETKTVKVYKGVTWNEGKSGITLGDSTDITATKDGSGIYKGAVTGITKSGKYGDTEEFWFAIAVPAEDGKNEYWLKVGSNWTNVTENKKESESPAGHMTFGIGDDGSGGDVELCISSSNTSPSAENATYYTINVTFTND